MNVVVKRSATDDDAFTVSWTIPSAADGKWLCRLDLDAPYNEPSVAVSGFSGERCTVDVTNVVAGSTIHLSCHHTSIGVLRQDVLLSHCATIEEPPLFKPILAALSLSILTLVTYFTVTCPLMIN